MQTPPPLTLANQRRNIAKHLQIVLSIIWGIFQNFRLATCVLPDPGVNQEILKKKNRKNRKRFPIICNYRAVFRLIGQSWWTSWCFPLKKKRGFYKELDNLKICYNLQLIRNYLTPFSVGIDWGGRPTSLTSSRVPTWLVINFQFLQINHNYGSGLVALKLLEIFI